MSDIDLIRKVMTEWVKVRLPDGPLSEAEVDMIAKYLIGAIGEEDMRRFYSLSILDVLKAVTIGDLFDAMKGAARASDKNKAS